MAGVVLGFLGVYRPLAEFAGAGATTPLSGFGYLISTGTKKAIAERGFLGIFSGGLTASAVGVAAALTFGYLVCLVAKGKPKQ